MRGGRAVRQRRRANLKAAAGRATRGLGGGRGAGRARPLRQIAGARAQRHDPGRPPGPDARPTTRGADEGAAAGDSAPSSARAALAEARSRGARCAPDAIACIAEIKRQVAVSGWIDGGALSRRRSSAYAAAAPARCHVLTDGPISSPVGSTICQEAVTPAGCPSCGRTSSSTGIRSGRSAREGRGRSVADRRCARRHTFVAAAYRPELSLDALVEAHDEDRGRARGRRWRADHRHQQPRPAHVPVDRELAIRLRPSIPADRIVVAESGIRATLPTCARLRDAGVDAILVGETLMRAPDPAAALRGLLGHA